MIKVASLSDFERELVELGEEDAYNVQEVRVDFAEEAAKFDLQPSEFCAECLRKLLDLGLLQIVMDPSSSTTLTIPDGKVEIDRWLQRGGFIEQNHLYFVATERGSRLYSSGFSEDDS